MFRLNEYTFPALLAGSVARFAGKPALGRVGGTPYTFDDVSNRAYALAAALAARGIAKGDRVALIAESRPEWGIAYLAVTCMGAVVVPVLTDFPPSQIGAILGHSGSRALFTSNRFLSKVETAAPSCLRINLDTDFDSLCAEGAANPATGAGILPDDLAAIIYTSGTTGSSKGVELSHRNIISDAYSTKHVINLTPRDCLLSILPMAHTYEFTIGFVTPFAQGAPIYYLDRPPTAQVLLPVLRAVRPTVMLSVPLIIEKIVRSKVLPELEKMPAYRNPVLRPLLERIAGIKLRQTFGNRIRFFGVGGAALSPDVEAFLARAHFPYAIGYGLTETSPIIAGSNFRHRKLRHAGPALVGVEMRIADPNPETGEGEIQVRGPMVMRGYYRDEERTKAAFTADGWFRTGDLGIIDRRGCLAIRGRLKTMILGPSGENIYPEEIESLLNAVDGVQESLVYEEGPGKLVALIYIDPAYRERFLAEMSDRLGRAEDWATEWLERIKMETNARLSAFSRLNRVEEQHQPFEKTPTMKIKRFLYPRES